MNVYSTKYTPTGGWYFDQCDKVLTGDIDRFAIPLTEKDVTFAPPEDITHNVPSVYRPVRGYGLLPLVVEGWTIALRDTTAGNRKVATLTVVGIREVYIPQVHDNRAHGMGYRYLEDLVEAWTAAHGEQSRAWCVETKLVETS